MKKIIIIILIIFALVICVIIGNKIYQNTKEVSKMSDYYQGLIRECKINNDCKEYISYNTCEVFCAKDTEQNDKHLKQLPVKCDATLWDRPYLGVCGCVSGRCGYSEINCEELKNEIMAKMEDANFCETDNDCKTYSLGCPFGCGNYVNKNYDMSKVLSDVESYQVCPDTECDYMCEMPAPPECKNKKCVPSY
jgi:uncharacterized protein YxeA